MFSLGSPELDLKKLFQEIRRISQEIGKCEAFARHLLNTNMLTDKQITKLENNNNNTDQVNVYWNQLQQSDQITEKQWETIGQLADMSKKQQRNYVIVNDRLILAPTKRKIYTKSTGEWKRNRAYENTFKDKY